MRSLASTVRWIGPGRRAAVPRPPSRLPAWIAAVVLHAVALMTILTAVRPEPGRVVRAPVALTPAPQLAELRVPALPGAARPQVGLLPGEAPGPPRPDRTVLSRPVPVPVVPDLRPWSGPASVVRAYREGTAPVDSAGMTEEGLRQVALAEATRRWNLEFHGLIPEVRQEMFLEALQNSPFPRR